MTTVWTALLRPRLGPLSIPVLLCMLLGPWQSSGMFPENLTARLVANSECDRSRLDCRKSLFPGSRLGKTSCLLKREAFVVPKSFGWGWRRRRRKRRKRRSDTSTYPCCRLHCLCSSCTHSRRILTSPTIPSHTASAAVAAVAAMTAREEANTRRHECQEHGFSFPVVERASLVVNCFGSVAAALVNPGSVGAVEFRSRILAD